MTDSTRTYPYKAWVLNWDDMPVAATMTRPGSTNPNWDAGDVDSRGKRHSRKDIFATKKAAVASAKRRLDRQIKAVTKNMARLVARRESLNATEGVKP